MISIELPWPSSDLSGHQDGRWRRKAGIVAKHRQWARHAMLAAGAGTIAGDADIRVHATFYPPDRRTDRVNMPNRLKPYWDGIADALKVNDRRFLPSFAFAEPVKNACVVVQIMPAEFQSFGAVAARVVDETAKRMETL
ncbi:hypothetical protein [Sphingomonas baiyangensis]|uniref:hypothetical protein n=1 Tax=Sphingomonas baiyangensis TaxID=2572576 RepID=UPI001BB0D50A|nr:hypothetical protein [Sphingomonas baiyangensis]